MECVREMFENLALTMTLHYVLCSVMEYNTERVITAKILLHQVHVQLRLLEELGCGKAPQNNHN